MNWKYKIFWHPLFRSQLKIYLNLIILNFGLFCKPKYQNILNFIVIFYKIMSGMNLYNFFETKHIRLSLAKIIKENQISTILNLFFQ